jgi:Zn-finger nucleic acid-binding protein
MKCPVCSTTDLLMTDRQGIEIDYCPQCRGVWLDRGELDKIIERSMCNSPSATSATPAQSAPTTQPFQAPPPHYEQRHGHDDKHRYDNQSYPRKKSVWQELFG